MNSVMKVLGILGIIFAAAYACSQTTASAAEDPEIKVGDTVGVAFICKERATVEAQIDAIYKNGGDTAEAMAMLERDVENSACAPLPGVPGTVTAISDTERAEFVDHENDRVRYRAYEVTGDGEHKYWTGGVVVYGKGT